MFGHALFLTGPCCQQSLARPMRRLVQGFWKTIFPLQLETKKSICKFGKKLKWQKWLDESPVNHQVVEADQGVKADQMVEADQMVVADQMVAADQEAGVAVVGDAAAAKAICETGTDTDKKARDFDSLLTTNITERGAR